MTCSTWMFSPGEAAALEASAEQHRSGRADDLVAVADEDHQLGEVRQFREVDQLLHVPVRRREDAHDPVGDGHLVLLGRGAVLDSDRSPARVADRQHRQALDVDLLLGRLDAVDDERHRVRL